MADCINPLEHDGFAVVPNVLPSETVKALVAAVSRLSEGVGGRRRGGLRNLFDIVPEVRQLACSPAVRGLVEPILGQDCFAVRGILFDKTPDANWKVTWHQDLSIAVQDKRDVDGFGPWSEKAGVVHVQPPAIILERMLTVRLHLDECGDDNGPLLVLPGSHRSGRLDAAGIQQWRQQTKALSCPAPRGGALLLRPLLLHASSPSKTPGHRRVIHLEFAAVGLPNGLTWHNQVC